LPKKSIPENWPLTQYCPAYKLLKAQERHQKRAEKTIKYPYSRVYGGGETGGEKKDAPIPYV
jgi:hypothetical protein